MGLREKRFPRQLSVEASKRDALTVSLLLSAVFARVMLAILTFSLLLAESCGSSTAMQTPASTGVTSTAPYEAGGRARSGLLDGTGVGIEQLQAGLSLPVGCKQKQIEPQPNTGFHHPRFVLNPQQLRLCNGCNEMGGTQAKEEKYAGGDSMSFAAQQTETADTISYTDLDGDQVSFELRHGTLSMKLNGEGFQQKLRLDTASGSCHHCFCLSTAVPTAACLTLSAHLPHILTVCNAPTLLFPQLFCLSSSLITF